MSLVRHLGFAALALLTALAAAGVGAQQVFRIVGPDGRVTFSDKPPAAGQAARPAPVVVMPSGGTGGGGVALPFELRTVANRYPVTLYSSPDCGPCASGRNFLASRGIPFNERTITSEDDIDALKRLAGAARLPLLTIGGQQLKGYSEPEWAQFLDAAGYPKVSQLPSGYRQPPAAPLVAVQQPTQRPPAAAARPRQPQQQQEQPVEAEAPPAEAPVNPAGIRF